MVNENKIERLTLREAHQIMAIAVQIEKRFVRDSLKVDLIGMNASLMYAHVEFMADRLLSMLGYEKRYNQAKTPFHFMENISMQGKTNFFERKNSEYMIPMDDKHELTFDFDEDF
jgi:ribonucleoside-diphosphate reductase beta chain